MSSGVKLIVALAFLVIALSSAYFFVDYLPKINQVKLAQAKLEQDVQNQQKCRDAGQKAYEADIKLQGGADKLYPPEYAYNSKLNTCLYGGGYMNTYEVCQGGFLSACTRGSWERFVKNSYTNKEVLVIVNMTTDGKTWSHTTQDIDDFEHQYEELMGFAQ